MLQLAAYALLSFGMSLALVPVCRYVAIWFGIVAKPRADRWHGKPTAMLGGAAIAITVLSLHALLIGVSTLPVLLVGGSVMFLIGLLDDVTSLKPTTKLVFVIAVASFFVFFRYRLSWSSSLTLDTLLTVLWIVGLTNAFNLLDNMDGLCAGLCLVAGAGVLGTLGTEGIVGPQSAHLALLMGAAAGFLVYNFHPASIFMGDGGSLFIGLNLAVLTLDSPGSSHASASLLSIMAGPALILMVPILDTTLVTVSRILSGRSAAQGGRDHSSHRLVAIGLSERAAVLVLWSLSALGGLLAMSITYYGDDLPGLAAALFVIAVIIFAVYLAHVRVYDDERLLKRGGGITPFVVNFVYRRRLAEVLLDLCLVAISYYTAYRVRFDGADFGRYFPMFLQSLPLVLGVQQLSLFSVGAYRGFWRYFGMMDGVTFAKGVIVGTMVNVSLLVYVYRFENYSRGVFVIYAALLMLLLAGSRASFRLISEFAHRRNQRGLRVVIYGVGDIAASAVRDILTRRAGGYRMLGFIADDPSMERMHMQGYAVLGNYDRLTRMVQEGSVDLVVITQLLSVERLDDLRQLCQDRRVALERLQLGLDKLVAAS